MKAIQTKIPSPMIPFLIPLCIQQNILIHLTSNYAKILNKSKKSNKCPMQITINIPFQYKTDKAIIF